MTEFTVHLANRPGQLATLARRLADAGVHLEAFAAFAAGEQGVVRLMADDDAAARRVLDEAGLAFDEHRVLATVVPNRPGALAGLTESLAETGVNIDAMYLLHTNGEALHYALAVNDPDVAAAHLAV
jgi:prephenate dehydrogenase